VWDWECEKGGGLATERMNASKESIKADRTAVPRLQAPLERLQLYHKIKNKNTNMHHPWH